MMNRALLSAIVLSFAVVGCRSLMDADAVKKKACKGGANCTVDLTVTGSGDPKCLITKSDKKLYVALGSPENLTWQIKTQGWDFDTNGIAFASPQFKCAPQGKKYVCSDKNTDTTPTTYPYAIALKNGSAKCTVDPMIVNGAADENWVDP